MKNKIGIGVITCNREDFFKKCIASVPEADICVIINDGKPYNNFIYPSKVTSVIQHNKNIGVGKSKNEALRHLMNAGCEHIFLCEDDILVKDSSVYDAYIKASEETGIQHFNYAYHGPGNRKNDGSPNPKKIIQLRNGLSISLNHNILGAFSYYSIYSLREAGLIDERYKNAWEHVDHTYQIIKLGLHPPFWWFADLAKSLDYISDLHDFHSLSVIRKHKFMWKLNLRYNAFLFKHKNGYYPTDIPEESEKQVIERLSFIQNKYSKK